MKRVNIFHLLLSVLIVSLTFSSCKKDKKAIYGINDVNIEQNSANKDHLKSTTEFISIFFSSDEYYTGQTNILFNRYLFRYPSSEESVNYSLDYINTDDYKSLQRRILSTNEFIGL